MSFFADFLVASPDEADDIAEDDNPTENWQGCSVKSLTNLDVANVYSILSSDGSPVKLLKEFKCLSFPEDGEGVFVEQLPQRLVDLLAELQDEQVASVAEQWSGCEEMRGVWDSEALSKLLVQLRELAVMVKTEGQSLLLCTDGI